MQPCGVCSCWGTFWAHGTRGELVPKMVWRVKLVAELEFGFTTEVEVARLAVAGVVAMALCIKRPSVSPDFNAAKAA